MQRHLSSLADIGLYDNHHSIVGSRGQTIVKKSNTKVHVFTAAILLAIGRNLYRAISREQLGAAEVADRLHPIACEIDVTDAKAPAMRLIRGVKDDLARADELQRDHRQCGPAVRATRR